MENKKEGILKKFWSKLKNFWNNLGIDVVDYKFTDKGFQNEINNRGMDERYKALQYNSADNCAVNVVNISGHIVKNKNNTDIAYENERE